MHHRFISAKNAFRAAAAAGTASGLMAACAAFTAMESFLESASTNPTMAASAAVAALTVYVAGATLVNDRLEDRLLKVPPKPAP